MRYLIIISFGLFLIVSCAQNQSKQSAPLAADSTIIITDADTSNYAILSYTLGNQVWEKSKPSGSKPTSLSSDDIKSIDTILSTCINTYNLEQVKRAEQDNKEYPGHTIDKSNYIIHLTKYKRQYIAVINKKGEKEVWVNCFCGDFDYWKKDIVMVMDGGRCFFNLDINLTKKTFYNFIVNGEA